MLAKLTQKPKYLTAISKFCDHMIDSQARTPKGLVYVSSDGPLRHAANVAFVCFQVSSLFLFLFFLFLLYVDMKIKCRAKYIVLGIRCNKMLVKLNTHSMLCFQYAQL